MASEEIHHKLEYLREDYARANGSPFQHFYCPFLCRDEEAELCLAHIVGEAIPNSCRAQTVQRADVDNFYGSAVEADFATLVKTWSAGLRGVIADPDLYKALRPRITVDGEECGHYAYHGHKGADHTPLLVECGEDDPIRLVLRKSPESVAADQHRRWTFAVERDFRICALASLIKSAYLTLFHLLGYRYALSAGGLAISYEVLGRFYHENREKDRAAVRAAAIEFFKPYRSMMRPLHVLSGTPPRGTLEDNRAWMCFGSSGRPFGMVVLVRTDAALHAVLLPGFSHPDSVELYLDFLRNDKESIRAHECEFDPAQCRWVVSPQAIDVAWPKKGATFEFV
jgi:hypothetical protein